MATVNVNVLCCHAGYEYDNKIGSQGVYLSTQKTMM